MTDAVRRRLAVTVILAVMSTAALCNLGNRFMWIDEALTAMLGKNVLLFGYPRAWDGVNLITATNGNCFTPELVFIKDNWLPHYMAAAGSLTGPANASLRLPFVLAGIAGAFVFWQLARLLINADWGAVLALAYYALSVPILLFVRQVRYYSPGLLFVTLTMYCYVRATGPDERNPRRWWSALAVSAILLFHSMYMFFVVTAITLAVAYLVFDRRQANMVWAGWTVFAVSVGTLPWFVYARLFTSRVETQLLLGRDYFWPQIAGYIWQIQTYYWPFMTLGAIWLFLKLTAPVRGRRPEQTGPDGVPLWAASRDPEAAKRHQQQRRQQLSIRLRTARDLWLIGGQILITIVTVSLFSHLYNNRFLIPALPACYLLLARGSLGILRMDRLIGQLVIILLLVTNLLGVAPYYAITWAGAASSLSSVVPPPVPFFRAGWNAGQIHSLEQYLSDMLAIRSYPLEFLAELTSDYDDANEGIVRFLWTYARPGDTVYVLGRDQETIAYYTGLKLVNRLAPNWRPWPLLYRSFPNAAPFEHLTAHPFYHVDWVVSRTTGLAAFENRQVNYGWDKEELFERITIVDYPDAPDLPEIWLRVFRTDHGAEPVHIYRNLRTTDPIGTTTVGKRELEPPPRGEMGL